MMTTKVRADVCVRGHSSHPSSSDVQELSVQVGDVDGIHVDHIDVPEAREGQVLEQLAPQAPSTDHQDPAGRLHEVVYLGRWLKVPGHQEPWPLQQRAQVVLVVLVPLCAGARHGDVH
jgi:hypothetical protein